MNYSSNHRSDTLITLSENSLMESMSEYDAFGNVKWCSTTELLTYSFSTKEYLADVEVYLYAYRAYDPIAGRWTQRDPIGYQDSVNLYRSERPGGVARRGPSKGCPRRVTARGVLLQFYHNNPVMGVYEWGSLYTKKKENLQWIQNIMKMV